MVTMWPEIGTTGRTEGQAIVRTLLLALIVGGGVLEVAGLVIGARELRDRGRRLRAFMGAKTPVSTTLGTAWDVRSFEPGRQSRLSVRKRVRVLEYELKRLHRVLESTRNQQVEYASTRVREVEENLLGRMGHLRDLAVGTASGGTRAYVAFGLLLGGLVSQSLANVLQVL